MQTSLQNSNSFADRLEQLIQLKGFKNANQFAKALEYKSPEKLQRLIRDPTNSPSFDILSDITNKFADINVRWLVTGIGAPLLPNNYTIMDNKGHLILEEEKKHISSIYQGDEKQIFSSEKGHLIGHLTDQKTTPNPTKSLEMPKIITVGTDGNENIVLVPFKAAAGYLKGYSDPQFIEKLPSYRLPGFDHGTFRMFEITGHSMSPKLLNRDKIVGRWSALSELRDSMVYVVVTRDDVLVKRVLNRVEQDGVLILRSDSPSRYEYPDIIIAIEDVVELWYGIGKISRDLSGPADMYTRLNDLEGRLIMMEHAFKKGNTST